MPLHDPVLILQHLTGDGPAYLRTWLERQGVPYRVCDAQSGQTYPRSLTGYRALAVLGGEMSANDDLDCLHDAQALIRQALAADAPVIGHCLGGQLLARVLGARVVHAQAPEIGWHRVQRAPTQAAADWFPGPDTPTVFQWHGERFELPRGAQCLASSELCPTQAFGVGRHLALQFHLELDDEKLQRWSADASAAYLALQQRFASVHSAAAMRALAATALPAQQRLADHVYRRWLFGG